MMGPIKYTAPKSNKTKKLQVRHIIQCKLTISTGLSCTAISPTAASARLCTIEEGILVHGCQLMVPWTLIVIIHGVAPPYVTPDLVRPVSTVVHMVEGNRAPTLPLRVP